MTKAIDPYSRVYWRAIDDSKFRDIWADDAALAAWLRLLVAADMAWPASASLYHGVRKVALDKLVAVKLVDLITGHRFRIHGLDAERAKRSAKAKDAADNRWGGSPSDADASHDSDAEQPPGIPAGPREQPPSNANGDREQPVSNANGDAKGMPSQEETRRDEKEPSKGETRRDLGRTTPPGFSDPRTRTVVGDAR